MGAQHEPTIGAHSIGSFKNIGTDLKQREREFSPTRRSAPFEIVSARSNWVEVLAPCQIAAAGRVANFLMHFVADLPKEAQYSLGKAVQELLLNAIEWGGKTDPCRQVRISFVRGHRALIYRIADPGAGFSFQGLVHAACNTSAGNSADHTRVRERLGLRPGGFGLLVTEALVDDLIFNEAHNEVLAIKYLENR
jgi:anti-sigma regulatory factor (Ser/Thr protein kinase)